MRKTITTLLLAAAAVSPASAQQTYTLEQLCDSAQSHNATLSVARRNIDAAHQQRREAFTKFFPQVMATGLAFNSNKKMVQIDIEPMELLPANIAAKIQEIVPPSILDQFIQPITFSMLKKGVSAGVMAVQPVFMGGQIVNGNKLARVGEDVSRLQLRMSENEVDTKTWQYYLKLVSLNEKLRTLNSVSQMLAQIESDAAMAVKAGVAMRNDLLQVQLRQNDIESQQLKALNGAAILKLTLAQHCGLRDTSFAVSGSEELPSPLSLKADHDGALALTPEYQLLEKQVEAARLQHRMTVGQNLPSVAVGAGYNYSNLFNRNQTNGLIFATVSVPIMQWWGGSHAIKRKKIEHQKAIEEQQDKSELLKIRMRNAWNNVTESFRQMEIAKSSIEQAEENLRLNRNYYKAGTSKMSDLLEAQLLYQQAHDGYVEAFANYQNRLLEYRQASPMAFL